MDQSPLFATGSKPVATITISSRTISKTQSHCTNRSTPNGRINCGNRQHAAHQLVREPSVKRVGRPERMGESTSVR